MASSRKMCSPPRYSHGWRSENVQANSRPGSTRTTSTSQSSKPDGAATEIVTVFPTARVPATFRIRIPLLEAVEAGQHLPDPLNGPADLDVIADLEHGHISRRRRRRAGLMRRSATTARCSAGAGSDNRRELGELATVDEEGDAGNEAGA